MQVLKTNKYQNVPDNKKNVVFSDCIYYSSIILRIEDIYPTSLCITTDVLLVSECCFDFKGGLAC